ncbi:MAG: hypothetical protein QOH46_2179 [Solirubrobacteraceae bacterium]|nr:hypothetical protein [Solirubrobacteraceae bacterium]MEA2228862.1 hypothetical protein [Solirubrobacteraceae bacterium]MEA2247650.1 hypothetical protein [Solirubrobacteraceae bacterium]
MTVLILFLLVVWVIACVVVVAICRAAARGDQAQRDRAAEAPARDVDEAVEDDTFQSPLAP